MRLLKLTFVISLALGLLFGLSVFVTRPAVQAAPTGTLQTLINDAPNGGTVIIPAGTYTESLTVNKTLTLTGVSSSTTIIQAVTGQRVITVTSGTQSASGESDGDRRPDRATRVAESIWPMAV